MKHSRPSLQTSFIAIFTFFIATILSTNIWAEEEGESTSIKPTYYQLQPPFVANFGTPQNKLKFVKADVSLKLLGADKQASIVDHDALIRHQIVLLLSRQTEESITNSAGQEAIRQEALALVQQALKEATGDEQVEDLLFTNFIVQR